MYIILKKDFHSDAKFFEGDNAFNNMRSALIEDDDVIIISTHSNTIRVPIRIEDGYGISWEFKEWSCKDVAKILLSYKNL